MKWEDELGEELRRGEVAETTGNAGKARTSARRAVGIVVTEFQRSRENRYGNDFMGQLRGIASDAGLPKEIREAADRLQSRITAEFTSRSEHPLDDARLIIEYFRTMLL